MQLTRWWRKRTSGLNETYPYGAVAARIGAGELILRIALDIGRQLVYT